MRQIDSSSFCSLMVRRNALKHPTLVCLPVFTLYHGDVSNWEMQGLPTVLYSNSIKKIIRLPTSSAPIY